MNQMDGIATEREQLGKLTPDLMRAYAAGDLAWNHIRDRHGVLDFALILRRLGEEGLRLPRASPDRPTLARGWLRDVLQQASAR